MTYQAKLNALAERLKRAPMTAKQIASAMRCCIPSAYQRLRALQERGERVVSQELKQPSKRGPRPKVYSIR